MFIGCSTNIPYKESGATIEGGKIYEICMPNGVVYYATATYRLAPKFNKDSKVETCNSTFEATK